MNLPQTHSARGLLFGALLLALGLAHPAPVAPAAKYAVLINGNGLANPPYLDNLGWMFETLVNHYGYAKRNVFVLSNDGATYDLDGDGQNDMDFSATRAHIFEAFDTLRFNRQPGRDDILFVYCNDHGNRLSGTNESYLDLTDGSKFEASELDSLFDLLQPVGPIVSGPNIFALFDECYSGGFLDSMSRATNRLGFSASKASEPSNYATGARPSAQWPSNNYIAFTYHWLCAMHGSDPEGNVISADANGDGHVSFREAFVYAKANDEYRKLGAETPQYGGNWFVPDVGARTKLDGTNIAHRSAGLCRGDPNRQYYGGAAAWGDGGRGGCDGSGILITPGGGPGPERVRPDGFSAEVGLQAVVLNKGTEPVSGMRVGFYYGVPSTVACADDSSLHEIGGVTLGTLAPEDTALAGPVTFSPPAANPYGQPYWKVLAVAEATETPLESGWVDSDDHVGVENYYRAMCLAGEAAQLRYQVRNPDPEAHRIVMRLARNTLPAGWRLESFPALGETLEVATGQSLDAVLTVIPDGAHGSVGIVTIEEELLKPFDGCDVHCTAGAPPTRLTEGGFIRTAGGISFEVTARFDPTPVLFANLTATWSDDVVLVSWFGHPGAGLYFVLKRRCAGDADFATVGSPGDFGVGTDAYRYLDRDVLAGRGYEYRVDLMGPDGLVQSFPVVSVTAGAPAWRVSAAYPNPSAGGISLEFSIPSRTPATVTIFDVTGRLVGRRDLGVQDPGSHAFTWDGRDRSGRRLPAGTYLLKLETREATAERRVVLVR